MAFAQLSVKCGCKHAYQDALYGAGTRVAIGSLKNEAECTVCGTKHREFKGTINLRKKSGTKGRRTYFARPPVTGWVGGNPEANGWRPGGK